MSEHIYVLYVDDDEDLLAISNKFLTRPGDITVSGISCAEEAITLLKDTRYDVIISDYELPGMDGIAFLKYLKGQGDTTPFILFTGKSREDIAIEALNNGAAFYLQKGEAVKAIFTELEGKIRSAVAHRRAIEDLRKMNDETCEQYAALQRSKEDLKNTTDLLENLIHIAQNPILVWDHSCKIIRLNHACSVLTGRRADELIGLSVEDLFSPEQAGRNKRLFQVIRDGARWERTELDIRHQDGSIKKILWNSSTLYAPDGITPVATIAQGNDVTDENRLKHEKDAALEQIQKNLAQLAFLNDEIRNPLMVISMCADQYGASEQVDQIFLQIRRIDEMVSNLDKRWAESETVLQTIRKHYQIDPTEVSDARKEHPYAQIPGDDPSLVEEVRARLFTILDSIDALVYVADMDTYELLYTNRQGRAMLGNIIGKRCYHALHPGLEKPCPFCTNQFLTHDGDPTGVYRWEFQSDEDGRWYDCRDRAIRWSDGRIVHLTISTDITERRKSEEKFRSYIDNAPEGVFLADEKGNYIFVNDAACQTTGYTREELLSKNLIDLTYPDDIPKAGEHFQKVAETGSGSGSVRFLTRDREVRWWAVKAARLSPDRFLGFTSDITTQRKAEEALRESEEKYRKLSEDMPVCISTFLPDGTLTYVNKALSNLTGFSHEALVGQCFFDLLPSEQLVTVKRQLSSLSPANPVETHEQTHIAPDGSQHIVQWMNRAFFDENANAISFQAAGVDITAHRKAEQDYRTLFSEMLEGLAVHEIICDDAGVPVDYRFLVVNPAFERMTGIKAGDIVGRTVLEVLPGTEQYWIETYGNVVLSGSPAFFENYHAELGKYFEVTAFRTGTSQFACIFQDVTKRKRAEEALRESEAITREILDATPFPVALVDLQDNNIMYWSRSALTLFGHTAPTAAEWYQMVYPDPGYLKVGIDRWKPYLEKAEKSNKPINTGEYQITCHDGSVRICELYTMFLADKLVITFNDITSRKQAEETLKESEERFRTLYENINECVALHEIITDEHNVPVDFSFLSANPTYEAITGLKAAEIIGKRGSDVIPNLEKKWIDIYGKVAQTGEAVTIVDHSDYLDRYWEIKAFSPMKNQFAVAMTDITIRKHAEKAQIHSLELLNETQQISKTGGWEWDVERQTMTWTDETYRIHGMNPGDPVSDSPDLIDWGLTCYDPADQPVIRSAFQCCIKQGKPYDLLFPLTRIDGVRIWIRTMAHAIMDEDRVVRVIGFIRDITDLKQAEAALKESESKYLSLFNNAILGIYRTTPQGRYLDMNPAFAQIVGYTSPQEMMEDIHDIGNQLYVRPEDRVKIGELLIRDGEIRHFETEIRHRDGHSVWISINSKATRNEDGSVSWWEGTIEDITARKQAEFEILQKNEKIVAAYEEEAAIREELRQNYDELARSQKLLIQSEERLRLAHKATNDVVWDWDVLSDTQQWNEAGTKVFGWTEIVEKPVNAQWWVERVHPDDRDRIHDRFFAVVNDSESDFWVDEYRFLKTDGTYADVMDRGYVLRDGNGRAYRMIGAMLDITSRKRVEEQLRESDARFRLAIKASSMSVFSQDTSLRYTWIYNPGPGVSQEDIIGKTEGEILLQKDADTLTAIKQQVLESGKGTRQYIRTTRAGRTFDYDLTIEPLQHSDGTITGIICASLDITDLKQTEEALLSSNQKLRLLTSLTRHDINNALTAIHLFHQMATEESDPQKKGTYSECVDQAIQKAEAIIRFTKEYEDFGVVTSGWQEVQSLVRDASLEMIQSGLLVEGRIHPDIQIFADPIIRKVFSTLIENAVRHAGILTRIQFSCLKADSSIIIVCEDDGIGVPLEEKEDIFEHGYGKHTGIGLFIAKEILAITGLSIRETGEPGKGARFEILVPDGKWRRRYDG
ncbi:MAG TPA: PAS domain S-box protein [Methanospirillum sp.]|nr:PAS domain S-box protein [Methanospirillum sp.]